MVAQESHEKRSRTLLYEMIDLETVARKFVSSQFDSVCVEDLRQVLNEVEHWQSLIALLEKHGLSPLAYDQIKSWDLPMEEEAGKTLRGLVVRHRRNWQALEKGLYETASLFRDNGIEFLCLKGSALANMIYPEPGMRPMCDLDIMVPRQRAAHAQRLLIDAGFNAALTYRGYLRDHHHLPAATRKIDNQIVMIELHTQALSPDMRTLIHWDSLTEPRQSYTINDQLFYTLGHIDMLRHLCLHTFTRTETVRLIGVTDMLRYASQYFNLIDWDRIRRDFPIVLNAFRCLHPLVKLPPLLGELAPPPTKPMKGVGKGMMPLQETMRSREGLIAKMRLLLWPPQWWTHVFYNVSPEKSLFFTRAVEHPLLLLNWSVKKNWHRLADKVTSDSPT